MGYRNYIMRLDIIHLYFVIFLLIVIARGIFNFPIDRRQASLPPTNKIFFTNTLTPLPETVWDKGFTVYEYIIMMITDIIILIGIIGLSARREIFTPQFWKGFLFIAVLVEGYIIYRTSWNAPFGIFLWSLAMILPAPYAIFAYGFRFRWVKYEKRLANKEENL